MPTLHIGQEIRNDCCQNLLWLGVNWREIGNIPQLCNFKQVELSNPRCLVWVCRMFLGIRNLWYTSRNCSELFTKIWTKGCKITWGQGRKDDGQLLLLLFSVGLFWKEHRPDLPFNINLEIRRLKSLENKLKKDQEFQETY